MTLVLLPRFNESPDSIHGYQLCQQLVKQGHDLYVTTASTVKHFESENKNAAEITRKLDKGSITIVQAQGIDVDQLHPQSSSFENLRRLSNVTSVIGLLPGTARTAVELKRTLKCKLVLLATSKLPAGHEYLRESPSEAAKQSEEIWSVGPDTYMYYDSRLPDHTTHKEVLLQPTTTEARQSNTGKSKSRMKKFLSLCSSGHSQISTAKKVNMNESSLQSFSTVCSALGTINNSGNHKGNIQWNVHGLKYQDAIIKSIHDHAKPDKIKLNALSAATSIEETSWKTSQAFIVPDIVDESLNFIALSAIWLGIPTIVSSQSSLGKFLLHLDCPSKTRPVVILSGNPILDREAWIDNIKKEILDDHANPMVWAQELSEYLHNNSQLWELDLSVFTDGYTKSQRRLSADTTMSYTTAYEKQPSSEVLSKVKPWLHDTEQAQHDQVLI